MKNDQSNEATQTDGLIAGRLLGLSVAGGPFCVQPFCLYLHRFLQVDSRVKSLRLSDLCVCLCVCPVCVPVNKQQLTENRWIKRYDKKLSSGSHNLVNQLRQNSVHFCNSWTTIN